MGKMSRDKGARFERELAGRLRDYGYNATRTAQHCGKGGTAADVIGLPHIHVEAKHVEKMSLYNWMEQAVNDSSGTDNLPAVFHKQNRKDLLVTMRFDDWMQLYNEFNSGKDLNE